MPEYDVSPDPTIRAAAVGVAMRAMSPNTLLLSSARGNRPDEIVEPDRPGNPDERDHVAYLKRCGRVEADRA